jgi:hypothetical protein
MVWNFQSNKRAQTQETNKPTFSGQNRQKIANVLCFYIIDRQNSAAGKGLGAATRLSPSTRTRTDHGVIFASVSSKWS